jgi:hypothetical protein
VSTRKLRAPSLESLVVATLTLAGFTLGARPIGDNSTFVHLRTGIDIASGHGIPRTDPYSFTARGAEWVVQSWLPEAIYGFGRRLAGDGAVVLEQAVLMALCAFLLARLARTGSAVRTIAAGSLAVGVGAAYWSPRPLLFGIACFALVVTVVEDRASRWWLVPIVWVWVNSHGSFPVGLAWLGLAAAGAWLDERRWPAEWARYVVAFVVGLAAACVNPLGPRLLAFAVTVGEKKEVFQLVREWRSPDFQSGAGLVTLVFVVTALVVVLRSRPAWQRVVPLAVVLAMSLVAVRNIVMLAVVLAPALGAALRAPTPRVAATEVRPGVNRVFAGVLLVAFVLFGVGGVPGRTLDVSSYPVASIRWLDRQGLLGPQHRLAAQDVVGCYLVLERAADAGVFIDDRVDMYPLAVTKDYVTLLRGEPRTLAVLDRWKVDVVLWDSQLPLTTILRQADGWRQVHRNDGWVVFRRSG